MSEVLREIGIVGVGSMGSAIARGLIEAGYIRPSQLAVCDKNREQIEAIGMDWPDVGCYEQVRELCDNCRYVVFAVKPNVLADTIADCGTCLTDHPVISIAAGWTVAMLQGQLEPLGARWLRVMPNTPALVGEGMTAICSETTFSEAELRFARGIFDALGKTVVLPERMFDGVIAISGSSPAYVYMMIEAMADGGVREGLPRKTAVEMAAQAVLGSALMVLNSGSHPAALKDAVCSPAGTTIEAVAALEEKGFREAILAAMKACADKSRDMAEK
ncbi:MAG: pyrroline-5-carboxylate reductase [Clostridia bacterium]|nr:pyrroline-5-carboxylate reductase [Clostridia bacterium]